MVYEASGNILMVLAVDFTHTVRDIELAIRYHMQIEAEVISPSRRSHTDRLLELCVQQRVAEIRIIVGSCDSRLIADYAYLHGTHRAIAFQ